MRRIEGSDRTWLILVVMALVVAVLYYLLEVREVAPQEADEVEYVWDLDADQIVGVRVVDHGAQAATVLERDAEVGWQVTEPVSGTAMAVECDVLAGTLAHMSVGRVIEEPPEGEVAAYGLLTPTYTIEVRLDDGRALRLEVGSHYPGGSYYARRVGEQTVLMIADYVVDDVVRILEEPPLLEATPLPAGIPTVGPVPDEP